MAHSTDRHSSRSPTSTSGTLTPTSTRADMTNDASRNEKVEGGETSSNESEGLQQQTTNHELGDSADLQSTSSRASGVSMNRVVTTRESVLARIRSRQPIGTFTHPLAHQATTVEQLVEFEGPKDDYLPLNWTLKKKIVTTILYGLTTMTATYASSSYSAGTDQVAEYFHVGTQTATLGTSLFLFGFGVGPLLWAPLSEVYGRKAAVLPPVFVSACFTFGTATAKDLQTVMITRFFAGFFGSAPVTNTGGVLGDLYNANYRGIALAGYAMAVVGGPVLGPIISAAVVAQPYLGWRWTEYLTGILQLSILVLDLIFLDESYPPLLLVYKARRLRIETGNWSLHAKFEEWDVSIKELATKFLIRPFQLLGTPICFLMALYASFCYGILYMQLGAIPIIFGEIRGWKAVPSELPFLSILVGTIIGASINVLNQFRYNKQYNITKRPIPEARLPPMMLGSVLFASGQFIIGWTAAPRFHWIAPVIGLFLFGLGFFLIFQAALNYLVDTFQKYAASAIGANTFLRSAFAGAFPLVVAPLYHNIGAGPGSSITGGFAALLIPVPFIFFVYGKQIRTRSKWSRDSVY